MSIFEPFDPKNEEVDINLLHYNAIYEFSHYGKCLALGHMRDEKFKPYVLVRQLNPISFKYKTYRVYKDDMILHEEN